MSPVRTTTAQRSAAEAVTTLAAEGSSMAFLDRLCELAIVGIALSDEQHRIVWVNEAFTELFGYSAAEAVGRFIDDLVVAGSYRPEAENTTDRINDTDEVVRLETERFRADGSPVPVQICAAPVFVDGKRIGHCGYYLDLTRLREAQIGLIDCERSVELTIAERTCELIDARDEAEAAGERLRASVARTTDRLLRGDLPATIREELLRLNREVLRNGDDSTEAPLSD